MLTRKTNNFNDFSRYYSEENQELLEKESKLAPYILLSILFFIILFAYLLYSYFFHQKNNNIKPIITKETSSPLIIKQTQLEEKKDIRQKKNIETVVIENKKKERLIEKHSESKEATLPIKTILIEKQISEVKTQKNKIQVFDIINTSDKKNLDRLSAQLEKIVRKKL